MKAKEVLDKLQITRPTLTKYVKEGLIKVNTLPNGRYDYNEESVYKLLNKGQERENYIYVRTARSNEENVKKQLETMKSFAMAKGLTIDKVKIDNGEKSQYEEMMNDVLNGKVQNIIVQSTDRITRKISELNLFMQILEKNNCKLLVLDKSEDINSSFALQIATAMNKVELDFHTRQLKRMEALFDYEIEKANTKEMKEYLEELKETFLMEFE